MLKLLKIVVDISFKMQPPSGGCVLKRQKVKTAYNMLSAATFGWLCVETARLPT